MKKKVVAVMLAATMIMGTILTGCGSDNGSSSGGSSDNGSSSDDGAEDGGSDKDAADSGSSSSSGKVLKVWTFTDEVETMINDYYLADNPDLDYEIEVTIIPTDSYQTKLDPALQAGGADAPDIFCVEAAYAQKYLNSNYTMTIDELGISEDELADITEYVKDVARDEDGNIKGVAWQACPGAFYYRRSLAEEYLGTSEPDEVQEYLKDWDTFLDTARLLSDSSDGAVRILTGPQELKTIFLSNRETGWIVEDGGQEKFVIDPLVYDYMDMARTLQQESLAFEISGWSEGWFSEINNNNVFGYILPTWGLHYVLKTNADNADTGETTAGDWGMVQGPGGYFSGGTWVTGRTGTEMKDEVADFIRYATTNEEFLAKWAKETGDFLGNTKVVETVKDDFSEEFLGGQNHYAAFAEMTEGIDASNMTGEDSKMDSLLTEEVNAYIRDEKDKETAIADFIMNVQNAYPNLVIE